MGGGRWEVGGGRWEVGGGSPSTVSPVHRNIGDKRVYAQTRLTVISVTYSIVNKQINLFLWEILLHHSPQELRYEWRRLLYEETH